jgi:hypothetical protein
MGAGSVSESGKRYGIEREQFVATGDHTGARSFHVPYWLSLVVSDPWYAEASAFQTDLLAAVRTMAILDILQRRVASRG